MRDTTKTAAGHTRLEWKVFDASGTYVAATLSALEAAILVSVVGGDVRYDSTSASAIVWREGIDGDAGESYDGAESLMLAAVERRYATMRAKRDAKRAKWTNHRA